MPFNKNFKRGLFQFRNFPRFSFLILLMISVSYSQTDSGYVYYFSGGSEYFDLFRQRSENSRTVVFSKNSFASFSAASGMDSLSIVFYTLEHYTAMNQKTTKFSTSFKNSKQNVNVLYSNSWSFLNYSFSLGTTFNTPSRQLNYSISILVDPFDQMLSGGISFERLPIQYNTSILFQDFLVPIQEIPVSTSVSYTIQSKPFRDFSTKIEYYDTDGKNHTPADIYNVPSNYQSIGKKLALQYSLWRTSVLTAEIGTDEYRTELLFTKNGLSFGDLLKGFGKYSHYMLNVYSKELGPPLSFKYTFDQVSLSALGHFESWPFTTLAASIITNRLNYQLSGFIKHHSLKTGTEIHFGSSLFSATLSYHRILPDAVLEHWEPEILVFGMKNFTSDPFSISDIHLGGIKLHYQIPLDNLTLSVFVEQYIPLSVKYRKRTSEPSLPPGSTTPSSSPITDGGRKAGVILALKF